MPRHLHINSIDINLTTAEGGRGERMTHHNNGEVPVLPKHPNTTGSIEIRREMTHLSNDHEEVPVLPGAYL